MAEQGKKPTLIFCYAPEKDRNLQQRLEQILRVKLSRRVEMKGHYSVLPGEEWQTARRRHFERADVIVLLISADFFASDRCREEVALARSQHETRGAIVLAVILRPVLFARSSDLQGIPVLPISGEHLAFQEDRDKALWDVAMEICTFLPPRFLHDPELELIYCYAREDEKLRDELAKHLEILKHSGEIRTWYDREILGGSEWEQEIDVHLNGADIILLLISANFIASRYCYTVEMQRALERHKRKDARIIPIILSPVDWQTTPIGSLQALPRDGKPITTWHSRDQAFLDVVEGIHNVIEAHAQGFMGDLSETGVRASLSETPQYWKVESGASSQTASFPEQELIDKLCQELRASYAGDRVRAARALGTLGSQAASAVPTLRKALKDTSGPVRNAAAWALTEIGTEDAKKAVREFESR